MPRRRHWSWTKRLPITARRCGMKMENVGASRSWTVTRPTHWPTSATKMAERGSSRRCSSHARGLGSPAGLRNNQGAFSRWRRSSSPKRGANCAWSEACAMRTTTDMATGCRSNDLANNPPAPSRQGVTTREPRGSGGDQPHETGPGGHRGPCWRRPGSLACWGADAQGHAAWTSTRKLRPASRS